MCKYDNLCQAKNFISLIDKNICYSSGNDCPIHQTMEQVQEKEEFNKKTKEKLRDIANKYKEIFTTIDEKRDEIRKLEDEISIIINSN